MSLSNFACNCCERPPAHDPPVSPFFTIESRTKLAGITQCGFFNEQDGKYYKKYIEVYSDPWTEDPNWSGSPTITIVRTRDYNPEWSAPIDTCLEETIDYIPESIVDIDENGVEFLRAPYDDGATFNSGNFLYSDYEEEITPSQIKQLLLPKFEEAEFIPSNFGESPPFGSEPSPPFSFGTFSFGFHFRIGIEAGAIQQSQFRITHPPSATGYLKIWFDKVIYNWDQELFSWVYVSREPFDAYIWSGGIPNPQNGVNDPENRIISQVFDLQIQDDEAYEIAPRKWSMLQQYEPVDPTDIFPIGLTTRPIPDCFSNNFPTVNGDCSANLF